MVLMLAGLVGAPLAFARVALNTIDGIAVVTDRGRLVIATGPINCTRGEQAFLRVTVTQRATGAVTEGRSRVVCTGNSQQWQVHAATQGAAAFIRPKGFEQLPPEFREIGPSYRAANPEGVKAWIELEHKALIGPRSQQTLKNEIKQARLKELKLPTLLIAGAADLYTPPSISRMIAAEIPNSRLVVIPESGHSIYWERPELFNRAVLDFIGGEKK